MQLLDEAPEIVTTLFYFILQSNHKEEYKTRIKNLFENSFTAWSEKMTHFFNLKLTPAKLKNIVRVIDLYFIGLSVHVSHPFMIRITFVMLLIILVVIRLISSL